MPGSPIFGAHETSRTQSSCPFNTSSSVHFFAPSSNVQMRTMLSEPPVANFFCRPAGDAGSALAARTLGAHETAFAPVPCAGKIEASVDPSSTISGVLQVMWAYSES
jgi:hypothetical protein